MILKEHKENFIKIFKLAKIELIKTYRGAILGWLWAIIKPIVTILVYWFTIEIGLKSGNLKNGYSNFLWLIASTVPWFYFSEMVVSGTTSIRSYSHLITKIKFPISIIPTIVNISKFFVHIIMVFITILIFIANGYSFDFYMLQVIFYMILGFVFFEAWSMFTAIMGALSKDFVNLVKSINVAIFWVSGIIWDLNAISIDWIQNILWFNPIAYLVNGYRNCFINKVFFFEEPKRLCAFLFSLLIITFFSFFSHKKFRKEIVDVL